MPWRPSNSRMPAYNKCINNYTKIFDLEDIVFCDSGSKTFNKAMSINAALEKEFSNGLDVAIVSDADTVIKHRPLMKGIIKCFEEQKTYLPYDIFAHVSINFEIIGEKHDVCEKFLSGLFWPCTAIFIMPKKVYEDIGGFDENFYGWGPEDQEYHYRYYLKYGERYSTIENSIVYSIDHSRKDWYDHEQLVRSFEYLNNKHPGVKSFEDLAPK